MSRSPRPSVGRAELATLRLLMIGIAVAVVVSAIAALIVVDPRGRVPTPAWFGIVIALAFAVQVVAGIAAPWLGARALRRIAAVGVALFLLAIVLFAPVAAELVASDARGTLPWSLTAVGTVVVAAVAASGARLAWATIIAWVIAIAVYRIALGGYSLIGLANDAHAVTVAATLCVIASHAMRAGRALDTAAAAAESAQAQQGAARGRLAARARVAAFVHDEVLAALRGAAEGVVGAEQAVRLQARRARAIVDADAAVVDWVEQLRGIAREAGAHLRTDIAAGAIEPTPTVVEALTIAARQALENSARHAGECERRVLIEGRESGILVRISDDGPGFSPERIAPGRLGIATSIIGAMRDVAGGTARVSSVPGEGTTVELRWEWPAGVEPAGAAPAATIPFPRAAAAVVVVLFVLSQTLVAVVASTGDGGAGSLVALIGILLAALLTLPALPRGAGGLTAAVLALTATVVIALLVTPAPVTYGTAWFLPAAGFVLVAVSLRGRPSLAIGALLLLLAVLVADAGLRGGETVQIVSTAVRTATIVGLGTLLSVTIIRMQRSTRDYAHRAAAAAGTREWETAARQVLEEQGRELDALAGPTLARVAAGGALDPEERAHARALEGRLRDGYRAGRLHREPLIDAAMRARVRGVDVVLLDDAGADDLEEAAVDSITAWMRTHLDGADARVVGRLLPAGRELAAQVVVDGRVHGFPA